MHYETLLCDVREQVATVTLNRPKVLHSLNTQVFDELEAVFQALAGDSAVRVILLTGSGEKAFAAGADINELVATDDVTGLAKARRGQAVFRLPFLESYETNNLLSLSLTCHSSDVRQRGPPCSGLSGPNPDRSHCFYENRRPNLNV